ncbi:MAG TPA: hypothetical protein VFN61_06040 [Acidimicrobiales bacterium]|nr:hypothetical protein [Acidimicrobiales bacterium]
MLFDSVNPAAWDPRPHQAHAMTRTIDPRCGYCVRSTMALPEPDEELLDIALAAFSEARRTDLSLLLDRCTNDDQRSWVLQWPGEHYRLLTALVKILSPTLVVEVGTFTGMGALAILQGSPSTRVVTYDIIDWRSIPGSLMREEDFADGRLEQRLGDLSQDGFFSSEQDTLADAEFLFVDGPKDGRFESVFFSKVIPVLVGKRHVLMADDIHFINMVSLWMSLPVTKLDVTSFGHWSGTGLMMV